MKSKSVLKDHADLVDRMAQTVGLDLELVMMEGRMTVDQLGDAVLACTGCTQPDTCRAWMAEQADRADTIPSYCRNRGVFDRLVAGKTA